MRPLGGHRRLSFGAQLVYTRDVSSQAQSGDFPFGGSFAGSCSSRVAGSFVEHAGYVTFQFAMAGFTVLPGVRIEGREYQLSGATNARPLHTTHAFPSLHLERALGHGLTSDASYSRRVTYPGIAQLDPALIFNDATTAYAGNPAIRPQLTDSYEVKLHAALHHHNIDFTLFRRTTHDIWSSRAELNAQGVLVTRQVNFGTQSLTGGELAARGPLAKGLRYVVSANVSGQSLDANAAGPAASRNAALYSGSAQLEYRDGTDGRRGADRINLTLRYFGANDTGFTRFSAWATASATWSHALHQPPVGGADGVRASAVPGARDSEPDRRLPVARDHAPDQPARLAGADLEPAPARRAMRRRAGGGAPALQSPPRRC